MGYKQHLKKLASLTLVIGVIIFILSLVYTSVIYTNTKNISIIYLLVAAAAIVVCIIAIKINISLEKLYYIYVQSEYDENTELYHINDIVCPECKRNSEQMIKDAKLNLICPCGTIYKHI